MVQPENSDPAYRKIDACVTNHFDPRMLVSFQSANVSLARKTHQVNLAVCTGDKCFHSSSNFYTAMTKNKDQSSVLLSMLIR